MRVADCNGTLPTVRRGPQLAGCDYDLFHVLGQRGVRSNGFPECARRIREACRNRYACRRKAATLCTRFAQRSRRFTQLGLWSPLGTAILMISWFNFEMRLRFRVME